MQLLSKLYKTNRTLLSDGNEVALNLINDSIPLKIHRFKSGTKSYDWTIPKKWIVNKGILKDLNGNVIVNSDDNILHLLNYSNSYTGIISITELLEHVHYNKKMQNAIPYRTNYYSDNWGFCLSYNQVKNLTDEKYYVDIDTEFVDGELLIGESTLKGKSDKEVILSSYYCHPNQINDGLSGVILLINLYNKMKNITKNLKYTYKFFFWPETIGAITALSRGLINSKDVEYALVATTVGYGNDVYYKKTYLGNHSLDNIVEDCIENVIIRDYNPTGSDERQFSSNGIRIPSGVLTATPYQEFNEYHTSEDNLNFISMDVIDKMVENYMKVLLSYEKYYKYKLTVDGGEPFLSKYNLYRDIGIPGHTENDILRNWVIHYCDGNKNVKDISKILNISEKVVEEIVNILLKFKIVREVV